MMKRIRLQSSEDQPALAQVLDRSTTTAPEVEATVAAIVADVRQRGDLAVAEYTERFDGRPADPTTGYEVSRSDWEARAHRIDDRVREALTRAAERIRSFHSRQMEHSYSVTEDDGSLLALRVDPLHRAGIYVPGGTALYPSSVLMTAIPARVAGVRQIIMVTPGASPETLAAALIAGVDRVFEIGGAQAVAALAYGTATVPRVDKIVGPGNQWVATAKRIVFGEVDIDSVAGPSEILVIADDTANPDWVAADLLAQAEHDREARPILVTFTESMADAVDDALERALAVLPRREIASASIERYGATIIATDRGAAISFANEYAAEHLELCVAEAGSWVPALTTSGAIFVGHHTPEAAGDYVAGPNHVLPTGGAARYASPLGVYDFVKRTSILSLSPAAMRALADDIEVLAKVEGLEGHGRSATLRRDTRDPS